MKPRMTANTRPTRVPPILTMRKEAAEEEEEEEVSNRGVRYRVVPFCHSPTPLK